MIPPADMPILQPIPIITKARDYWIRLIIWIVSTRKFRVVEDWYFQLPNKGPTIKIPKGFEFNGASIPRPFWWILSPAGLLLIPGLIHDYAYKKNKLIGIEEKESEEGTVEEEVIIDGKGKVYWDGLFRDTAIEVNGFLIVIWLAWLLLIVFGWVAWWKHRGEMFYSNMCFLISIIVVGGGVYLLFF